MLYFSFYVIYPCHSHINLFLIITSQGASASSLIVRLSYRLVNTNKKKLIYDLFSFIEQLPSVSERTFCIITSVILSLSLTSVNCRMNKLCAILKRTLTACLVKYLFSSLTTSNSDTKRKRYAILVKQHGFSFVLNAYHLSKNSYKEP